MSHKTATQALSRYAIIRKLLRVERPVWQGAILCAEFSSGGNRFDSLLDVFFVYWIVLTALYNFVGNKL
jgi:hypothetical protein